MKLLYRYKRKFIEFLTFISYITINLLNLSREGYGYPLYTAIIDKNIDNFKNILKTSLDSYGFFAVGKPPLFLIDEFLSVKILGLNAYGILLPSLILIYLSGFILGKIIKNIYPEINELLVRVIFLLIPSIFVISRVNIPDSLFLLTILFGFYNLQKYRERGNERYLYLTMLALASASLTKLYLTSITLIPFLILVIFSTLSKRKKIRSAILIILTLLLTPILWALYYYLSKSSTYIGGTGDSNPFTLIFLSQGVGRIIGSLLHIKFSYPVMPNVMLYQEMYSHGIFKLINEPYFSQYGYMMVLFLVTIISLTVGIIRGKVKIVESAEQFALLVMSASGLTIFSLSTGPVCCTHSYYSALLTPGMVLSIFSVLKFKKSRYIFLANSAFITLVFLKYPDEGIKKTIIATSIASIILLLTSKKVGSIKVIALGSVMIPILIITSYTYKNITLSSRYGDPIAGVYGVDNSIKKRVDISLDSNLVIKNVGQDASKVEEVDDNLVKIISNEDRKWSAATLRAYISAPLSIRTKRDILPIGGEVGAESTINLKEFLDLVRRKELCLVTIGSRDIVMLSTRHSISKYSDETIKIYRYILTNGDRVEYKYKNINAPALFRLCS